jgi:selenobiotic family peptide radical SAM maturase
LISIKASRRAMRNAVLMLQDPALGRSSQRFTLQWHLTHACDLRCKHCYDRTMPSALKLEGALAVLDQLEAFMAVHDVRGSVCFSGGNPLLYKHFFRVYESAARRGLGVSILGNPVDDETLDRILAIKKPAYFQVSLEGLEPHNDHIRGAGFYSRVLEFLPKLRARGIQSVVMSTLTRDNLDDIVPLSKLLRPKVDRYAYNRLAQVGEGAALAQPDKETYARFMIDWMLAAQSNTHLGFKDNLFNLYRHEFGQPLYGGCTGYGCGAAFNFLALLPNGDVHACRKMPSMLGNLSDHSLVEIYASDAAERYRRGSCACDDCAIRHRCGGCMAVVHGAGLDRFEDRDPHCFMYD